MAYASIAGAQTNTPPSQPPPGPSDGTTPPPRPRRAQGGLQAILAKCDLTDDEKTQVKPIVQEQNDKLAALRQDSSLSREDRRAKQKEIMDATVVKLKGILTADQFTKFEELRKQMGPPGRPPGGPPPAGTPGDTAAPKPN